MGKKRVDQSKDMKHLENIKEKQKLWDILMQKNKDLYKYILQKNEGVPSSLYSYSRSKLKPRNDLAPLQMAMS